MENLKYVSKITLADEVHKTVGFVQIKLGDATIGGITVWRSANGKLSVFFPSRKVGSVWEETLSLPYEIREEVEAEAIALYRERKHEVDAAAKAAKKVRTPRKRLVSPDPACTTTEVETKRS